MNSCGVRKEHGLLFDSESCHDVLAVVVAAHSTFAASKGITYIILIILIILLSTHAPWTSRPR